MSDLISRDRVMSKLGLEYNDYVYIDKYELAKKIESIPSADAVEVVRCKDCRFWKNEHLCLVMSRYGSIGTKAEHYCSWGERREP